MIPAPSTRAGASRRPLLAMAGIGALLGLAADCQSSSSSGGINGCTLTQVTPYPPSPLMLLPDARLDRVADGFFLYGVDKDTARWVHVDGQRVAGKEQSALVPPARLAGPWLAAAGRAAPADTVLIAYAMANGANVDLTVVSAPADGSAAPGAPVVVATIADAAKAGAPPPLVALGSSHTGMRAGLAWTAAGAGKLTAVVIGADGQGVGDPLMIEFTAPRVGCVGFGDGKADLSLAYLRYAAAADVQPDWGIAEMRDANFVEATLAVTLGEESPTCPLVLATGGGYALAFQSAAGSSIGVYDASSNHFREHLFASAVHFGGPSLQPPLSGLGPAGSDFAIIIGRVGVGEVWRVAGDGTRRPGTLIFPSEEGNLGSISSVPVGAALSSTYADYERSDAGSMNAGQRYLIETTCL